jgi:diguanylate cyclase (GGDEF)-like protein/PAS domain S-box-containing protein
MDSLQQRAEAALGQRATQSPEQFAALSPEAAQRVLHDLQVHQIELEMQNVELRRVQNELDAERARYFDLYDLAPVGYCTVTDKGLIKEVNLTTSTLFNVPRSQLIKQPIGNFIFKDDQGIYYQLRHKLRDIDRPLSCELRLIQRNGAPFWAHLVVSAVQDDDGGSELRIVITDITERKHLEDAAALNEKRMELALAGGELATWDWHIPSGALIFDARWAEMQGYTLEELAPRVESWETRVHPDDLPKTKEALNRHFTGITTSYASEHRVLHKDGHWIWMLGRGKVVERDSNSNPVRALGTAVDITARKAIEERVEALLRQQKAMLENDLIGIVTVRNRCIVWANPAFEKMLGFGQGELAGVPTQKLYASEEAFEAVGQAAYPLMQVGRVFRSEIEFVRKDGGHVWADMSGNALNHSVGEFLWGFVDITERKHAEEKLRQLSIAVEQSPTSVVITDLNASIEYVNAHFTKVTGYSLAEAIGQNPRIFKSGLTSTKTYQEMWSRLCSGLPWRGEIVNRRKNGEHYWEDVHLAPVKNPLGVVTHYVAVKADITERKQMEEQIRQLAFHDTLTSLPNRRLLLDRLAQALEAGKRREGYGALMYLDLDNFKPLNDQHGHEAGDQLLVEAARRLKACVRGVDTVSRIGGDEFVVLLGDLTTDQTQAVEQANKLAEKICFTLAQTYLLPNKSKPETIEHHCSASVGVVLIEPQHKSVEGLLRWADAAMYIAKAEGRNRVTFMVERRAQQRP